MKPANRKAMYAKNAKPRLSRDEWNELVGSKPLIVKDQIQMAKFFKRIDNPSGSAFSDLDHHRNAESRLDKRLEKLAKKHEYIPEGYTAYQAWHNHHKH